MMKLDQLTINEKNARRISDEHYGKPQPLGTGGCRIYSNKPRARNGGFFVPRPATRIPDWCAYGEVKIDSRSPFLFENITPSQRAYARELAIERKEAMQP